MPVYSDYQFPQMFCGRRAPDMSSRSSISGHQTAMVCHMGETRLSNNPLLIGIPLSLNIQEVLVDWVCFLKQKIIFLLAEMDSSEFKR